MTHIRRGPIIAVIGIALLALVVPMLPLPDPVSSNSAERFADASLAHLLGQDEAGRDVVSRLLWGAHNTFVVALTSTALAGLFGVPLGFVGSRLGRVTELIRYSGPYTFVPTLPLILLIIAIIGPGTGTLILGLAVVFVPGFAGAASERIVGIPRLALQVALATTSAIILECGLSFLGLGLTPPEPSWGLMIADASANTSARSPLLLLWPCAALAMTLLAMNFLCDALRDAVEHRNPPGHQRRGKRRPAPAPGRPVTGGAVLDVRGMSVEIDAPSGPARAVHDMSFALRAGETIAIIGERGAGKTLSALALLGMLPDAAYVSQGSAWLQGHNLLRLDEEAFSRVRGGVLSMMFQDPANDLDPVHRIGAQITEAMKSHFAVSDTEAKEETLTLLSRVGMPDPKGSARAYPHELSIEMRLRALIAIAIANDPRLLIVDEPAATLDVDTRKSLLALLNDIQRELGLGLILFSRDPAVAAEAADRLLVMYAGEIVEQGTVLNVLAAPLHPYTAILLHGEDDREPAPHAALSGCSFAPRCSMRQAACERQKPMLVEATANRMTRCLLWRELVRR